MSAVFFLGDGFVAAGGILLAFVARLFFLARIDAAFMAAIFSSGFGFNAAAFRKGTAGPEGEGNCDCKNG